MSDDWMRDQMRRIRAKRRHARNDAIGVVVGILFLVGIVWVIVASIRNPDLGEAHCFTYVDYHNGTFGSIEELCGSSKIVSSLTPPAFTRGQLNPATPAIFPGVEAF